MYVPEMYRFVMYYFQIPCTIDLQETIPGTGVGVCPRKLLKNGSMLIVHSQPIFSSIKFCILPIDIFPKLWLFFSFKAPISGIRVAGEFSH